MSRRIDVELTSTRPDGTWTWRAAGAKLPKGELAGSLIPDGVSLGDVVKVEADFLIDGIEILSVLPPKPARTEPERLEVTGTGKDGPGVTTQLAPKGRGRDRGGGGRDGRRRGGRQDGRGGDKRGTAGKDKPRRDEKPRDGQPASERPKGRRDRPSRPRSDDRPSKPKPKKLRPKRAHRSAVLATVPEEQRPIAEQVLRGGLPAVRQAIETQNEGARAAGQPEIDPAVFMKMAEDLLPVLKAAEWHDRADAAMATIEDVSLADLRSVVVAADGNARTDETRALAEKLRTGLTLRVDREHQAWLGELRTATSEGRTVRALRLSSRPPKAGTPLPADLLSALAQQASAALAADVAPQRWGTVLDAVSYSPARAQVVPVGLPPEPGDELLATVRKVAGRVPAIAALFGVEASTARRPRRKPRIPPAPEPTPTATPPEAPAAASEVEVRPEPETAASEIEPVEAETAASEVEPVEPETAASEVEPVEPETAASEVEVEPVEPETAASEVEVEPVEPETAASEVELVEPDEAVVSDVGE